MTQHYRFFILFILMVLLFINHIPVGISADYQIGERISKAADKQKSGHHFRTIDWDELIPADWDPMQAVKGLDLEKLEDSDPRAIEALEKMRTAWNDAPIVAKLDQQRVNIPGFVVPLDMDGNKIGDFLLVPYFGACIHVPPPPSNQVIHVIPPRNLSQDQRKILKKAATEYGPISIKGVLETISINTMMGFASYRIKVEHVAPYKQEK